MIRSLNKSRITSTLYPRFLTPTLPFHKKYQIFKENKRPCTKCRLLIRPRKTAGDIIFKCTLPCSVSSVQSLSHVRLFATPRIAAHQNVFSIISKDTIYFKSYCHLIYLRFSSVQFSRSVVSNYLRPHELQHTRLPVHH